MVSLDFDYDLQKIEFLEKSSIAFSDSREALIIVIVIPLFLIPTLPLNLESSSHLTKKKKKKKKKKKISIKVILIRFHCYCTAEKSLRCPPCTCWHVMRREGSFWRRL